jgi:hypothetical protein
MFRRNCRESAQIERRRRIGGNQALLHRPFEIGDIAEITEIAAAEASAQVCRERRADAVQVAAARRLHLLELPGEDSEVFRADESLHDRELEREHFREIATQVAPIYGEPGMVLGRLREQRRRKAALGVTQRCHTRLAG